MELDDFGDVGFWGWLDLLGNKFGPFKVLSEFEDGRVMIQKNQREANQLLKTLIKPKESDFSKQPEAALHSSFSPSHNAAQDSCTDKSKSKQLRMSALAGLLLLRNWSWW